MEKYRHYFNIDESYIPAVNEDVIANQPEVWKSYYPHESFVKLLNNAKSILTRSSRNCLWVEGAYGTGKSHAVLTLKKLLECSNEELKEYFDKYADAIGPSAKDLYNEYYNIKNQECKILTVHRFGSSDVHGDRKLNEYIQDSIIDALKENDYKYFGQGSVKDAIIRWLSKKENKAYFDSLIVLPQYHIKFNGLNTDSILDNLNKFESKPALQELIDKILDLCEDNGLSIVSLTKEELKSWIIDVINQNNLKAILFIWDEFSEYFTNNKGNLTGFQYLTEISESYPFYLCIVTHKSEIFFENSKAEEKMKLFGRFMSPHCSIELPDNMAFILTAHAMKKVETPSIANEWKEITDALYDVTINSRIEVMKTAKIGEKELKGIVPIHPYAALVLKHIASAYESNQRSMFDFIKNNRGDEVQGFQWFIDNYGPYDNALLTIDYLWNFFYEKGRDYLSQQIKSILDVYVRSESHLIKTDEKRVLKTILLLQAISEKVGDSVELFIPNEKNLGLAFEGTSITQGNAKAIADNFVKNGILIARKINGSETKYSAVVSVGDIEEIETLKEKIRRETRTDKLIEEAELQNEFKLPANISIRYPYYLYSTVENIKNNISKLKSDSDENLTRLYAVYTFGRNANENKKIREEIQNIYNDYFEKIIFIDYSANYFNDDLFEQYVDNMAHFEYYKSKDRSFSQNYAYQAKDVLKTWKNQIKSSGPKVFSYENQDGILCSSDEQIFNILKSLDHYYFQYSLETNFDVIDTMYQSSFLKVGVECGINRETKNTYKASVESKKLENQFKNVWNTPDYWISKPSELMSRYKNAVEKVIKDKFDTNTRVSISDIYDVLIEEPYGFMPCNLSAFVLGFILKEYANEDYNWSDDNVTEPMSVEKMKEMIEGVIKQQQVQSQKYKDNYIVVMSPMQREFNKSTAKAFDIDEIYCSSVENTRSRIRPIMNGFKFPIWTLKYCSFELKCSKDTFDKIIDLYVELANNSSTKRSETDIALEIGQLYLDNKDLVQDLKNVLNKECCTFGMSNYLEQYKDGELITLANNIGDTGSFLGELSKKFSGDSNWVWNIETINKKIDELIVEYSIVNESNKILNKTASYLDCVNEWSKKTSSFKVPYNSVHLIVGEIKEFLSYLYQIKKNGYLYDSSKEGFLNDLKNNQQKFNDFCNNQLTLLKEIAPSHFDGLNDEDISYIINHKIDNVYCDENNLFLSKIDIYVSEYKTNMVKYQLADLWKKKTDTETPIDWSYKYEMPISCMLPIDEQYEAKNMFDVINGKNNNESEINNAIDYLNNFKYFDDLKDSKIRDDNFKMYILKNYATLIDDINEIKNIIKNKHPEIAPYYWLDATIIQNCVKDFAQEKYNKDGNFKVNNVIDSMSSDDLKKYLKDLVKDNMIVGIEIIKNKK